MSRPGSPAGGGEKEWDPVRSNYVPSADIDDMEPTAGQEEEDNNTRYEMVTMSPAEVKRRTYPDRESYLHARDTMLRWKKQSSLGNRIQEYHDPHTGRVWLEVAHPVQDLRDPELFNANAIDAFMNAYPGDDLHLHDFQDYHATYVATMHALQRIWGGNQG